MHVQKTNFSLLYIQNGLNTQIKNTNPCNSTDMQYLGSLVRGGGCQKCVLPEGLAKEPPKIMKITKIFGSYRLHNGFNHFQIVIRCKKCRRCMSTHFQSLLKGFLIKINRKRKMNKYIYICIYIYIYIYI